MIENYKQLLSPSLTVPNYKEMCELLGEKILEGENKKAQLCEWRRHFKFKETDQSFTIHHIYDEPLKIATAILTDTREAEKQKVEENTCDKRKKKVNIRKYINIKRLPKSIDRKAKIYVHYEDRNTYVKELLNDGKLENHIIQFIECMYENKSQMKEKSFSFRLDHELSCLDELADYLLFCKGHEYSNNVKGYKCLSVSKFKYHDNDGFSRANYREDRKHNCVSVDDVHEMTSLKIGEQEFDRENTIYSQTELIEERELLKNINGVLNDTEEKDIINLYACGCRTADICRLLNLTESKVTTRAERIKGKISPVLNIEINDNNSPTTKFCRKCESELPLNYFGEDARNKKDGRKSYCRECINEEKRFNYNKIINVV